MSIEVRGVSKTFAGNRILRDVSLRVADGELVALLGPSGSGKTTLLRVIAGLEDADEGRILFDGRDATHEAPSRRGVGFVFQHYALFRHMTVSENVAFGLRVRRRAERPPEREIRARVDSLLRLVQLDRYADRYPAQLSGGQQQRVALARALAVEPTVLLLDEPFGALDVGVRRDLRRWLRHLHEQMKTTTVFVTHDQQEAVEVADRVVVMNDGRLEQVGTPRELFEHPANEFVCRFVGSVNVFHGRISGGRAHVGPFAVDAPELAAREGAAAVAALRPHDIAVERLPTAPDEASGTVRRIHFLGPITRVIVATEADAEIEVGMATEHFDELGLHEGERVFLAPRQARVFLDEPPGAAR